MNILIDAESARLALNGLNMVLKETLPLGKTLDPAKVPANMKDDPLLTEDPLGASVRALIIFARDVLQSGVPAPQAFIPKSTIGDGDPGAQF